MGSNDHLEGSGMGSEPEEETSMLNLVQSVSALNLESDELVVLSVPQALSDQERVDFHRSFQKACPNTRFMVADGGLSVETLSVEPEDKIVVRCPGALSREQREDWSTRLAAHFPENNCIVLEAGETVKAAREWIIVRGPGENSFLVSQLKGVLGASVAECSDMQTAIGVMDAMRARDEQKGE